MGTESGESDIQLYEQVGNYHRRDSMTALVERYERILKKGEAPRKELGLRVRRDSCFLTSPPTPKKSLHTWSDLIEPTFLFKGQAPLSDT
jgi:hypothetical protein